MEDLARERRWMYAKNVSGGSHNNDLFLCGVQSFVDSAIGRGIEVNGTMRCPCHKCKNNKHVVTEMVEYHLHQYGFLPNYYNWTSHGEEPFELTNNDTSFDWGVNGGGGTTQVQIEDGGPFVDSNFHNMLYDVGGPSESSQFPAAPYASTYAPDNDLQNLWSSCSEPAFEGCRTETELSIAMKYMQIKMDHNLPEAAFDAIMSITRRLLDRENKVPASFNEAKRLLSELGMGVVRIDVCVAGCMIFYKEDEHLLECRICGEARYKQARHGEKKRAYRRKARKSMFYLPIIPRLVRFFMTPSTAEHMSWHSTRQNVNDTLVHPCDGMSWKHFNACHPDFALETRNVRLGLCSDGFTPFGMTAKSYSCWPVMMTPYNLPPWMCMRTRFMWLTIMIPGPTNPKKHIDIYMRPLIDDLLILWNTGVKAYDTYRKETFTLRAALMWTVSDFPAYGMLSGWSTAGRLGCPHCMEDTKTFWLPKGKNMLL